MSEVQTLRPISRTDAVAKIKASKGKFFGVTFTKRTTGEERQMNCRLGVKKHLRGGEPAYDFEEKNLLPVFDLQMKQYRSISLDSISALTIEGEEFGVSE